MNAQMFTLTPTEIGTILANGGKITFRPMHRNHLKCNQVQRLKRLSAKQAASLRAQVGAYKRDNGRIKTTSARAADVTPYPTAIIDPMGDAKCPSCSMWAFSVKAGILRKCVHCYKMFMPENRKVNTSLYPQAIIDRDGDARCPSCNAWNWGVTVNDPTPCSRCSRVFVPVR